MKGLMIYGAGNAGLRDDLPMPVLGMNETLIKVKYAGVCGSDVHPWHAGIHYQNNDIPYVLGHEFVGTVVESNDDGKVAFKKGDTVVGNPIFWCGTCPACLAGHHSYCHHMKTTSTCEGGNGTFAEYTKIKSQSVFPINKDIDLKVAAVAEPLAVGIYDVRISGIRGGQSALISGGGTIGAMVGLAARRTGARVLFSEVNDNRISFLNKLGFDAINPAKCDALEKAKEWNNGELFDVVYEVSGAQPSYDLCLNAAVQGGTFMVIGVTTVPRSLFFRFVVTKQLRLQGVNCYEDNDFAEAVKIINERVLEKELKEFVTDVYPIDQAFEGYMRAMDPAGDQVKVVIDCNPDDS